MTAAEANYDAYMGAEPPAIYYAPAAKRCEWTDNGVRCADDAHPACEHGRCLVHAIAGWREALAEAIAGDDIRSMTECSLAILRLERMTV